MRLADLTPTDVGRAATDDVLPRAVTVSSLVAGGTGYVLLEGQGVDGCDVWALVTDITAG